MPCNVLSGDNLTEVSDSAYKAQCYTMNKATVAKMHVLNEFNLQDVIHTSTRTNLSTPINPDSPIVYLTTITERPILIDKKKKLWSNIVSFDLVQGAINTGDTLVLSMPDGDLDVTIGANQPPSSLYEMEGNQPKTWNRTNSGND